MKNHIFFLDKRKTTAFADLVDVMIQASKDNSEKRSSPSSTLGDRGS